MANGRERGAWGGGACGDESVVPHKGMLAGPLKMFITRKPHPTGIKLYCLADATWGYVVDMYLYTGVRGRTAVCTVADFKYSLCTYKNPKVGHKPPRVVPMLTNVWFARKGPPHRGSGREVHPVVAAYRTLSRGVDGVNQMALQMR